jgi:hypothetical protein
MKLAYRTNDKVRHVTYVASVAEAIHKLGQVKDLMGGTLYAKDEPVIGWRGTPDGPVQENP